MKKTIIYILGCVITVIIGIIIGWSIYHWILASSNALEAEDIAKVNTVQYNVSKDPPITNDILDVSSKEEKVTPNTKLYLKTYYKECGHSTKQQIDLPSNMINLTKEELENEFTKWKIGSFSDREVVLEKEEQGLCLEHYILLEENGLISIYWLDSQRNKTLKEVTDISTEYLPEFDRDNLKQGIEIYGKENLYMTLENYE